MITISTDYIRTGTVDSVIFFFLLRPSSSSCTRAALYTSSFSFYCPIPLSVFSSSPELLSKHVFFQNHLPLTNEPVPILPVPLLRPSYGYPSQGSCCLTWEHDHISMVEFSAKNDPGYKKVLNSIETLLEGLGEDSRTPNKESV